MTESRSKQRAVPRALLWLMCVPFLTLALLVAFPAAAQERAVPPLTAHVNDTANLLSPAAREKLEQKLSAYERKTGQQFALLTIDSLQGDALESFSIRVVEAWKLGKKGKDDGLLLLLANKEHKLRIEVGYGLEGDITDAFSARVIRNVLVPAMRAGNPAAGFDQAFSLLMQKASGEAVTAPEVADREPRRRSSSPFGWLVLLFFISPILIPLVLARIRGGGGRGGPWGGGGGWGGGFGGGGFGGGGFGGGGSWGGGGGGGGWGGGGGGGFGGGGASDSW